MRKIARPHHVQGVAFWPLLVSSATLAGIEWIAPDTRGWSLLLCAGIGSVIAWVGMINAYKSASQGLLAPS